MKHRCIDILENNRVSFSFLMRYSHWDSRLRRSWSYFIQGTTKLGNATSVNQPSHTHTYTQLVYELVLPAFSLGLPFSFTRTFVSFTLSFVVVVHVLLYLLQSLRFRHSTSRFDIRWVNVSWWACSCVVRNQFHVNKRPKVFSCFHILILRRYSISKCSRWLTFNLLRFWFHYIFYYCKFRD